MDSGKSDRKNSATVSDLAKAEKEKPFSISWQTVKILKELANKGRRFEEENDTERCSSAPSGTSSCQVFSADRIMKLARAKLQLLKSWNSDSIYIIASHFGPQSGLPSEISQDLELALLVQASAEKVACRDFACARRLLRLCDDETFKEGSPVQRTVYYFARALRERIEQEWGKAPSRVEGQNGKAVDVVQTLSLKPPYMAAQLECPFSLATACTAVQSIFDSVSTQKKIHLIDFGINNGSHWTIMMQALASRSESPLEHLKITAVGTSEEMMKEIGERLSSFAESLNIKFSFKIVMSELKDLREDLLELEDDEAVVVYIALRVYALSAWHGQLEHLLGLIKNLNPCLILVREVEVSTNLPNFTEQFNEALLFFSAAFDCIKVCMRNQLLRKMNEEHYLGASIQNIMTASGSERIHHERIDGWRALFARYNIVETELSRSSLCHARLLLKSSAQWSCCSLDMDGKCLILNWNETRMMSLSAWKPLQ